MVGISMGDGQMTKANLKKTMKYLTKGLEQANHQWKLIQEIDPLFTANVVGYFWHHKAGLFLT